jgi:hypothetical protein
MSRPIQQRYRDGLDTFRVLGNVSVHKLEKGFFSLLRFVLG